MINTTEEMEELKVWRAVYDLGFQSILGPRNHAKRIEKVNKDFKLYQIYIIFELYSVIMCLKMVRPLQII